MKKHFTILCIISIMMLTLSACGGAKGPSTNFKVNMIEFTFMPSEFIVPAGKEITITAVNGGAVVHKFQIFKLGQKPGDQFEETDMANVYWELQVEPGDTKTATFTAPAEQGEYYVTCGVPGHHEAGMNGKLIVVGAK